MIVLACAAALAAFQGSPEALAVQLPSGAELLDALHADVDGDGRGDLVIARAADGRRTLAVHLAGRDGRLEREPSRSLDLPPDVVAFLVADVHADEGAEVVLLNARGAFAWRSLEGARPPVVKLVETDFLWQIPDGDEVFAWPWGARDLDGDGLADLCLPEPSGYRVALQRRVSKDGALEASFPNPVRLAVPDGAASSMVVERGAGGRQGGARARRRGREVAVGFDEGGLTFEESLGPLLSIFEATPAPVLIDWDGDGDLDLMANTQREVLVWRLGGDAFPSAPSLRLKAPVERDVGRQLDVSFSAHAVELAGDGRADAVVFAGDKRSEEIRTQGLVFVRGAEPEEHPLFGAEGVPRQVLVLAGFVAAPRFCDVDGDGRDDLVVTVLRPDLIDAVRAASTERIDVQLYVYLNRGGTFSRRPDLEHEQAFSADSSEYALRFVADVDGNGLLDLFVRDVDAKGNGRVALHRTRRERDKLTIVAKPFWELAVDGEARLEFPGDEDGLGGREAVLVLEEEQVLCVRWR